MTSDTLRVENHHISLLKVGSFLYQVRAKVYILGRSPLVVHSSSMDQTSNVDRPENTG